MSFSLYSFDSFWCICVSLLHLCNNAYFCGCVSVCIPSGKLGNAGRDSNARNSFNMSSNCASVIGSFTLIRANRFKMLSVGSVLCAIPRRKITKKLMNHAF